MQLIRRPQIVFNPSTYPNFLRFLSRYPALRAAIQPTDMTFAVSRDGGAFEWAGASLAALFCQARRLADPRMWRMLYDILRFNACARRVLLERGGDEVSIGEYLRREGYSEAFSDNFLMVCVVGWLCRVVLTFVAADDGGGVEYAAG